MTSSSTSYYTCAEDSMDLQAKAGKCKQKMKSNERELDAKVTDLSINDHSSGSYHYNNDELHTLSGEAVIRLDGIPPPPRGTPPPPPPPPPPRGTPGWESFYEAKDKAAGNAPKRMPSKTPDNSPSKTLVKTVSEGSRKKPEKSQSKTGLSTSASKAPVKASDEKLNKPPNLSSNKTSSKLADKAADKIPGDNPNETLDDGWSYSSSNDSSETPIPPAMPGSTAQDRIAIINATFQHRFIAAGENIPIDETEYRFMTGDLYIDYDDPNHDQNALDNNVARLTQEMQGFVQNMEASCGPSVNLDEYSDDEDGQPSSDYHSVLREYEDNQAESDNEGEVYLSSDESDGGIILTQLLGRPFPTLAWNDLEDNPTETTMGATATASAGDSGTEEGDRTLLADNSADSNTGGVHLPDGGEDTWSIESKASASVVSEGTDELRKNRFDRSKALAADDTKRKHSVEIGRSEPTAESMNETCSALAEDAKREPTDLTENTKKGSIEPTKGAKEANGQTENAKKGSNELGDEKNKEKPSGLAEKDAREESIELSGNANKEQNEPRKDVKKEFSGPVHEKEKEKSSGPTDKDTKKETPEPVEQDAKKEPSGSPKSKGAPSNIFFPPGPIAHQGFIAQLGHFAQPAPASSCLAGSTWANFGAQIQRSDQASAVKAREDYEALGGDVFRPGIKETYADRKNKGDKKTKEFASVGGPSSGVGSKDGGDDSKGENVDDSEAI